MKKLRVKKGIILSIIIILIVIVVVLIAIKIVGSNKNKTEEVKVVDSISQYGYTLDERDTALMKEVYNELKSILNSEEIDNEAYAKTLAKLFIIDLYTMDNKINKYDVGSAEYVYPDNLENYKLNVEDTLYKSLIDNSNGKRKQELPIVSKVDIINIEESTYKVSDSELSSYVIDASWEYEHDLGYDSKARLVFAKKDNKYYLVSFKVDYE